MDTFTFIILLVFEIIGVCFSVQLWSKPKPMKIVPRIFWSVVLLVPVFGLLMFIFITNDLDRNPDRKETRSDHDAFLGGGR